MITRMLCLMLCVASAYAETPVEKAWNILTTASQEKSYEKRMKAVQPLGMIIGNSRAQSMAETALKDDREEVRAAAAEALGLMDAKSSAPLLKKALQDKATAVVFSAANALFMMDDPAAYQVYYAVLLGEKKSGDALLDSQLKMLKDPKALTKMGFETGIGFIPFGGVSYKVFKMATSDTVSPMRAVAAMRLAKDPDPKTKEGLRLSASDPKWLVRTAVIGAIARRGDRSMLPAIVPLMDDENDVVRYNAAAAVIRLSK